MSKGLIRNRELRISKYRLHQRTYLAWVNRSFFPHGPQSAKKVYIPQEQDISPTPNITPHLFKIGHKIAKWFVIYRKQNKTFFVTWSSEKVKFTNIPNSDLSENCYTYSFNHIWKLDIKFSISYSFSFEFYLFQIQNTNLQKVTVSYDITSSLHSPPPISAHVPMLWYF